MCESSSGGGLSYSYSAGAGGGGTELGTKVEMVYNLLSMLGSHDRTEMTSTLLAMSSSPDSCMAMRHSGAHPILFLLSVTRHINFNYNIYFFVQFSLYLRNLFVNIFGII